jgi:hypothetical protein
MTPHEVLHRLIPYRLNAVATFTLALRLRGNWEEAPPTQLFVDGKLTVEGNLSAFTNPAIEVGVIHCRALLEFLGLCRTKSGKLGNLNGARKADDAGIEHFSNSNGPLPLVTPSQACARYPRGAAEAENALLAVFQAASKGVAHLTVANQSSSEQSRLLEIASRGVPALVVSHLYTPLGLETPDYQNTERRRDAC